MTSSIIDMHCHPLLPLYRKVLGGDAMGVTMPDWSPQLHLDTMDEHDIAVGVLSLPSLGDALVGAEGRAIARALNEKLAELVADYPDRFAAFAVLPMDDMDAANEEASYALDVLKLDGVGLTTHRGGAYLGETVYDPLLEELHHRGATLFVHPTAPANIDDRARLNVSILEFMFDTTRMVTNMVLSGAKARFADIKFIATHGGGTIPYLSNRIEMASGMAWSFRDGPEQGVDAIHDLLASFYYDLTASTSRAQLAAITELVPTRRLLLGTDFPLMPTLTITPSFKGIERNAEFDEAAREQIRTGNAISLLPRLASSGSTAT